MTNDLSVGMTVRYGLSRPGGRAVRYGVVLKVYPNTVLVAADESVESEYTGKVETQGVVRSVRRADVVSIERRPS